MPRPSQERRTSRPLQEAPRSSPVEAQVAARPTDFVTGTIPSGYDPDLDGLVRGLSAISPALEKYAEQQSGENRKQGEVARAAGESLDESKGTDWVHGYMALDGKVKGEADAAKVWSAYQTEFDKDGGDLEAFIKERWKGHTEGLQAGAFLDGYRDSFVPLLAKLRSEHLTYQNKRVSDTIESNALQLLDGGVRAYINAGQPVPDEYIDSIRGHLNGSLGVSNSRFNALLFGAIKRLGDEGNFAIYDTLKRPRPDGTPGMYFIPEWKEAIDQAQIKAQGVYLAKASAADEAAQKDRADRQDQALLAVFLENDTKRATALFDQHIKSGLFTRANELIGWRKKLEEHVDGKPNIGQMDNELGLLQGIYARKVKPRDILSADITRSQLKYLLNELEQAKSHDRTLAAQGQAAAAKVFSSPEYRAAEDYLTGMLKPRPKSPTDYFSVGSEFDRAALAAARRDFFNDIKNGAPDPQASADKVVQRYMKRREGFTAEQQATYGAGKVPFKSLSEARDAAAKGLLTPREFNTYMEHFKQNAR